MIRFNYNNRIITKLEKHGEKHNNKQQQQQSSYVTTRMDDVKTWLQW